MDRQQTQIVATFAGEPLHRVFGYGIVEHY
jgi:hypothetical protein